MTIWRMRFAYWIPKATDINSEYVCFSNATTRLDVILYVHRPVLLRDKIDILHRVPYETHKRIFFWGGEGVIQCKNMLELYEFALL